MKNRPQTEAASILRVLLFLAASMLTGGCQHDLPDAPCGAALCDGGCGSACAAGQRCVAGVCTGGGASLTQRSCAAAGTPGCGMVPVTGGTFTMGEGMPAYNASPVQSNVRVGNFAIDAYEVTVARFRTWMDDGQRTPQMPVRYRGGAMAFEGPVNSEMELNCGSSPNYRSQRDREDHPINCVNWATAQAFCVWDGGRLPTQAEWEFAARGTVGRVYPWGGASEGAPTNEQACWSGAGMLRPSTCPINDTPMGDTPGGIHDLSGNVKEWNADWYVEYRSMPPGCWANDRPSDPMCNDRAMSPDVGYRVLRGGTWRYPARTAGGLRPASREWDLPTNRYDEVGFRCARDMP